MIYIPYSTFSNFVTNFPFILVGFLLGVVVYMCILFYFSNDVDETERVYNCLLKAVDKDSEVSKEILQRLSPSQFKSPIQLLNEIVRFKYTNSPQAHTPSSTRMFNNKLPPELFEPTKEQPLPEHLSTEVAYMLRAFEGLELPKCWKLNPAELEVMEVQEGSIILGPGDPHDVIFVTVKGMLSLYTFSEKNSTHYNIKNMYEGECYFALTTVIEVLMNQIPINHYVKIRAAKNTKIVKYRFKKSFYDSYKENAADWTRTIQVVMTRLQHCTLVTCNLYLGIGGKCINEERKIPDPEKYKDFPSLSIDEQFKKGTAMMAEALGAEDDVEFFRSRAERVQCVKGSIVTEQNSFKIDLIFLAHGKITLKRSCAAATDETGASLAFDIFSGDVLPSMQILTNEPAMCTATAMEDCIFFRMKKDDFILCLTTHPIIYLRLAYKAIQFISTFAKVFDIGVNWIRIDTGEALFRQGDISKCMYVVMGGRLRAVKDKKIVEEYGRLDVFGLLDMTEGLRRDTTVFAVRFSHLVSIPNRLLVYVKSRFPQVANKMLTLLTKQWKAQKLDNSLIGSLSVHGLNKNLRTIAIVPASEEVPLTAFTCELYNTLSKYVKALRLTSEVVGQYFSKTVVERKMDYLLMHWLTVQEIFYEIIIYQCDFNQTSWTRRCLRMADAVLVVANGNSCKKDQGLAEQLLLSNEKLNRQTKELIVIWPKRTIAPYGTGEWMQADFYSACHHLRAPDRMFEMSKDRNEAEITEYYEKNVIGKFDILSDFARLARILTGNAIGVVFGGGGARGAAHAGALRALIEKKVPIDMVGGTSIGALFSAMYASTPNIEAYFRMEDFFRDRNQNNIIDVLSDLTWNHTSLLTGYRFNKAVERILGNHRIEDCWIPYFCITTDICTSTMRVHRNGVIWPYARASMSIAGYLPPVCDPVDGHLLLDGAYVNNLPADVMKSLGASKVIAIDVGMAEDNTNLTNYGLHLSGSWVLFRKWCPFLEPIKIPNMTEIQNRLAYVCCVHQLDAVKKAPYCSYIKIPVDEFGIFNFARFKELSDIGYATTLTALNKITITNNENQCILVSKSSQAVELQSVISMFDTKDLISIKSASIKPCGT